MAVVVPIPSRLGRTLRALQRRIGVPPEHDLAPHIPLAGPFDAAPPFLPLERHCCQVCHERAPFEVALGPLALGERDRLVFAEVAAGREHLGALRQALLRGKYAPPSGAAPYQPRALVARLDRAEDASWVRAELAETSPDPPVLVERVALVARYPDGSWYEHDVYALDRAVARA